MLDGGDYSEPWAHVNVILIWIPYSGSTCWPNLMITASLRVPKMVFDLDVTYGGYFLSRLL